MKNQHQFATRFILGAEDGGSTDPNKTHSMVRADPGNWSSGIVGVGAFIGSNHGVTAKPLAGYRNVPLATITVDVMHALTLDEAADIAVANFYKGVMLDRLPWSPLLASVMEFGWGAGYNKQGLYRAIVYLQHLVGATTDGKLTVGGETAQKLAAYLASHSMETACLAFADVRIGYYNEVIKAQPSLAYALKSWTTRTFDLTPEGKTGWWAWFNA